MDIDASNTLQRLGRPNSLVAPPAPPLPSGNPAANKLGGYSLLTRLQKACKDPLAPDRISSEWYPLPAEVVRDARPVVVTHGNPSRMDGRPPFFITR